MSASTNAQHYCRPAVFWLIVKKEGGHEDALTLGLDGEEESRKTLPVFCFEDEARMFLSFGTLGDGWQPKETTVGELTSILLASCAGVEFVALDPLPELVCRRMVRLVSLRKKQFVDRLISNTQTKRGPGMKEVEPFVS